MSGVTDYYVICSAESERQVLAVKDHIDKVLSEKRYRLYGVEGTEVGAWVLMDYDDVVVQIFKRGVREHYGIDRLWSDAKRVPLPQARSAEPAGAPRPRRSLERSLRPRG